jgi:hypothetical protein
VELGAVALRNNSVLCEKALFSLSNETKDVTNSIET